MKTMKLFAAAITMAALFAGCKPDEKQLTVSTKDIDPVVLSGPDEAIVLSVDNAEALAMTLNWTDNSTVSSTGVTIAKNSIVNTLQFAAADSFDNAVEQLTDTEQTSKQFTVSELNSLVNRLGFKGDVASDLKIRMKSVLAQSQNPVYSNVLTVSVTPYSVDMSRGVILNKAREDSGMWLYSENSDGIYRGFMGVSDWYNFWLQEGNGVLWGNLGVDGKPFYLSSDEDHWNFWFPGKAGCYYAVIDTQKQEWSALYIPSLTVSGDVSGEMTFNKSSNTWTMDITTSASSLAVQISGTGAQYNTATGTDDDKAVATAVGFGQNGEKISFGGSASTITVPVTATGEVSLILDLSDPANWTCTAGLKSEESKIAETIWLAGDDDGRTGSDWGFNSFLRLYDEESLNYAAAVDFNSLWGYKIFEEKDNWADSYGAAAEATAESGNLVFSGGDNIPAPSGLHVLDVDLKHLTYSTFAVTDAWVAGFNDVWDLVKMTATETPGVFTASVSLTAGATPWGFKVLLDEEWNKYFGNTADGKLLFSNEGKELDASYSGDYTLTVNLCTCTWELTK